MLNLLVVVILGYLLGSLPTGVIAGKTFRKIDLREHGSGNMGATNSFRVLGWKAGLIVAAVDFLKGVLAVTVLPLLVPFPGPLPAAPVVFVAASLAAVLGHVRPLFAGFRGGMGFGTAAGAVTAGVPLVAPFCLLTFFVALFLSGHVAVSAAATTLLLPLFYLLLARLGARVFDPLILGFFIFAFLLTLVSVRKKLRLYIRGEAELFEKVMILRRRNRGRGRDRGRSRP